MHFLKLFLNLAQTPVVLGTKLVSVCDAAAFSSIWSNQQGLVRFKSRKAKGYQKDEEDSDDSDDEQGTDDKLNRFLDAKSHVVQTMRADLLLKTGLNIARK